MTQYTDQQRSDCPNDEDRGANEERPGKRRVLNVSSDWWKFQVASQRRPGQEDAE